MNMPEFTAQASLYTTSNRYRSLGPEVSRLPSTQSVIEPQLRVGGGGGGGASDDCIDRYQNCYIDCSLKYSYDDDSPDNLNSMLRDACFDSCDAAYRTCRWVGGAGFVAA